MLNLTWTSVSAVVDEFGLVSDPNDLESVRREVIQLLRDTHPDVTGGFKSDEQKQRYYRLNEAKQFIDGQLVAIESKSLVPIIASQMGALTEAIKSITTQQESQLEILKVLTEQQTARNIEEQRQQREQSFRASYTKDLSRQFRATKISSAALGAFSVGVITLGSQLAESSLIKFFSPEGQVAVALMMAVIFVASVGMYIITWRKEQRIADYVEHSISDTGIANLFDILRLYTRMLFDNGPNIASHVRSNWSLKWARRDVITLIQYKIDDQRKLMDFEEVFVRFLKKTPRREYFPYLHELFRMYLPPRKPFLTVSMAAECTTIVLGKLEERGLIESLDAADVDEWYQIIGYDPSTA